MPESGDCPLFAFNIGVHIEIFKRALDIGARNAAAKRRVPYLIQIQRTQRNLSVRIGCCQRD